MTKEKFLKIKGYDDSYTGYLIKYFYDKIKNFEKLNFTVEPTRPIQKIYNNEHGIFIEITPHTLIPKLIWDEKDIYDVIVKIRNSEKFDKEYTKVIGKDIVDIIEHYFSEILN